MTREEVIDLFAPQWIDPETKEKVDLQYYFYLVHHMKENYVRIYKNPVDELDKLVEHVNELKHDPKRPAGLMPRFYAK